MSDKKNTSLIPKIIESLRRVAMVPVEMDGMVDKDKITMSRLKLEQIMSSYEVIYGLVSKCWSNLPDPPCDEKTYLFVWIIASDDYCINHRSISWDGASANTFVHVWSIMDRIRMSLERTDMSWAVGSRNCSDFCRAVNMPGALDVYLYRPEPMTPSQILDLDKDIFEPTFVDYKAEFCSYYDFCMDTILDTGTKTVNVSEMALMNEEISRRSGTPTSRRAGSRAPP
jgi:hypothetical protein